VKFGGIIRRPIDGKGAIYQKFPTEEARDGRIKAARDVVLFPPTSKKQSKRLNRRSKRRHHEARINESSAADLAAKYRLGLIENAQVDLAKVNESVENRKTC
jgi:beta-glucosidase-like glycosyl hydrolase